jgi:hypothetical protein
MLVHRFEVVADSQSPAAELSWREAAAPRGWVRLERPLKAVDPVQEEYSEHFKNFLDCTNEKKAIAKAVIAIARQTGKCELLDLGAGDGELTKLVAPGFKHVTAVERNRSFFDGLKRIRNADVRLTSFAELKEIPKFNLALMSYSFSGVSIDYLEKFLAFLGKNRADARSKIIFVTYEDYSPWAIYMRDVYGVLSKPIEGGTHWHERQLKQAGYKTARLQRVFSSTSAESLSALVESLSFIATPKVSLYQHDKQFFEDLLRHTARENSDGSWTLDQIHNVIEILPRRSRRRR